MSKRVVLSGCSGGGKSTLLAEISRQGYQVVNEPGRRVIAEQRNAGGSAFPWVDLQAFAQQALAMSATDIGEFANPSDWVFFDRGLIDAASALSTLTNRPISSYLMQDQSYHRKVFLTPPWPEIFVADADRQHPFSDALEEYERLLKTYPSLGYDLVIVPKTSVERRAAFVLEELAKE